jgi:hypothetical protein
VLWRAFAHPGERAAWLAIGLGMVSFFAAEVYDTLALQNAAEVPYPSIADALDLGLYPACFIGLLLLLVRARGGRRLPWVLWVDGVIIALGFVAVVAALLFNAIVDTTGGDLVTVATKLAYPMSDVLLLSLVAGLVGVFGVREWRAWSVVASGFALLGVADTTDLFRVAAVTYEVGGGLDVFYYRKQGRVVARTDRRKPYKRTLPIHLTPGPHHVYARVYYKRRGRSKVRRETVKRRFTVCA